MRYKGTVKNGVIVLDDDVRLPDGAVVEVDLAHAPRDEDAGDRRPTLYERLRPVIGAAKGLPPDASANVDRDVCRPETDDLFKMADLAVDTGIPDLATNIDHYLYGHPKATDAR